MNVLPHMRTNRLTPNLAFLQIIPMNKKACQVGNQKRSLLRFLSSLSIGVIHFQKMKRSLWSSAVTHSTKANSRLFLRR